MRSTALAVLTDPVRVFARRTEHGLVRPALVVATSGLLQGLVVFLVVAQFNDLVPDTDIRLVGAALVPVLIVAGLLAWLAVGGLLFALSYPVAGRGSGRALLAAVGWGWLPQTLGAAVLAAAALVVVSQLQPPTDEATAQAFGRQFEQGGLVSLASVAGTARATATGSFSQLQRVVMVTTTLWSGYIWVAALRQVRELARLPALLATAVPVALMFGL